MKRALTTLLFTPMLHAALLMQWDVTLTPNLGNQAVVGQAVWNEGDSFITFSATYDSSYFVGLTEPMFITIHEANAPGFVLGTSPTVSTWNRYDSFDYEMHLDGCLVIVYENLPGEQIRANGFWSLTTDNRTTIPYVQPPPIDPEPPGGGGGTGGGGGPIPEPSTYALLSALGLIGFAIRRRLCHA